LLCFFSADIQGSCAEIRGSCADTGLFIQGAFAGGTVFLKNKSTTRPQTRKKGVISKVFGNVCGTTTACGQYQHRLHVIYRFVYMDIFMVHAFVCMDCIHNYACVCMYVNAVFLLCTYTVLLCGYTLVRIYSADIYVGQSKRQIHFTFSLHIVAILKHQNLRSVCHGRATMTASGQH